ncbi:hypothetical protein ACFLW0_03780 [Chloroflexota bacterium]
MITGGFSLRTSSIICDLLLMVKPPAAGFIATPGILPAVRCRINQPLLFSWKDIKV